MKTGKSLIELATEIQRQADGKRDYVTDTRSLEMTGRGQLAMDLNDTQVTVDVTPHSESRATSHLAALSSRTVLASFQAHGSSTIRLLSSAQIAQFVDETFE